MDYTIEHKDGDEEYYVYFNGSFVGAHDSFDEAKASIRRLEAMDAEDEACYSYPGPAKSPSVVWDSIHWAD